MKCSRCNADIKNLPDYLAETGTELLCSKCAGTADRRDDAVILFDRYHRGLSYSTYSEDNELEIAA